MMAAMDCVMLRRHASTVVNIEELAMGRLRMSVWLRRTGLAAMALGCAGAAMAHPGHDHGTWMAEMVHLLRGLAPLLALLAVGVGGSVMMVMSGREGAGAPPAS
jgi:hypothetical protein